MAYRASHQAWSKSLDAGTFCKNGPGSSVGIESGYGLDGPGIEFRWRRGVPHLSRPTVGLTQPSIYGYLVFPVFTKRPGRDADLSPASSAEV
jgi:hypothetical protein